MKKLLIKGAYTPAKNVSGLNDRGKSFQMQNNVSILGGFNGTEMDVTMRDWKNNPTILSGKLGVKGGNTDNAYHVFFIQV